MRRLRRFVGGLPGIVQLRAQRYEALFLSPAGYGLFRGVFDTFDRARGSVPQDRPLGPDAPGYSEHHVDRADRVFYYDYPVMFWLREVLREGMSVFDLGGNVGVHYYAYRAYLSFPANFNWTVCEVATLIARGEQLAKERGATSIRFTLDPKEADGCDVLVTSGALQYVEQPRLPDLLGALSRPPRHLFVNKFPLYEGKSFVTLQNAGPTFLPQYVVNRAEFLGSLAALGYELRDEWETPHLSCRVPFHPERSVPVYSGLYLRRRD